MVEIDPLEMPQIDESVRILTTAFANYVLWKALLPDKAERDRVMPVLWRGVVTYSRQFGRVTTTPDMKGVAAWVSPGYAHLTLWRHMRAGFLLPRAVMMMSMESKVRFLRTMSLNEKIHRQLMPTPHWYLWALGTDPAHQGQGIGGDLIASGIAHAQQVGLSCYLETQEEKNVEFYRNRGFEVLRKTNEPKIGLKQWFMCKPAD